MYVSCFSDIILIYIHACIFPSVSCFFRYLLGVLAPFFFSCFVRGSAALLPLNKALSLSLSLSLSHLCHDSSFQKRKKPESATTRETKIRNNKNLQHIYKKQESATTRIYNTHRERERERERERARICLNIYIYI